jgi:nicotinamide mononucleotide transporter
MSWSILLRYLSENWLEYSGVATTVLGIWLTTQRRLSCWPTVLISDVIYLVVFYRARLLSDALLQIFFLAFTVYGWWYWVRGAREEGEVRVEEQSYGSMAAGVALGVVGSVALGAWMKHLNAALPYLDATLTAFSLVASWWAVRKHISNWWLWIAVDAVYVGEYIYKGLWPTAGLYAGLVGLAALGVRDWRRAAKDAGAADALRMEQTQSAV